MHNLVNSWTGYLSLVVFILAYALVIFENRLHLRKSKPVLLAGCLMWAFVALYESANGGGQVEEHVKRLI